MGWRGGGVWGLGGGFVERMGRCFGGGGCGWGVSLSIVLEQHGASTVLCSYMNKEFSNSTGNSFARCATRATYRMVGRQMPYKMPGPYSKITERAILF